MEEERVSSCFVEFLTREKFAIRVAISLLISFPFETKNLLDPLLFFSNRRLDAREFRFVNEFSSNSKIGSRNSWSREPTVTIILRRTVEQRISEDRPIYHPDKEITMGVSSSTRVRYRAASKSRKLGGDEARQ